METIAGRFGVRRTLGQGGMGAVFEVVDLRDGRRLALKRLITDGTASQEQMAALFQREFHTLSRLTHPAIIAVQEYAVDEVGPFYTMELLEGDDLRSVLPLSHEVACTLLHEVASALSLLHTRQLVHRDITSRNIRVVATHRAKLFDFGALAPIGYAGPLVGTPPFVPPEALYGRPLDERSDLFSLGVVLYQTLTGQLPYRGRGWAEIRAAWDGDPIDVGTLVPDLPAELVKLTMSLIAVNPAARPRSAGQVMEQLGRVVGIRTTEPPGIARSYLVAPDLVARDVEMQHVRTTLAKASKRKGGGLVVSGPSGVGRTRFLDEAMLEARMRGAVVVSAGTTAAPDGAFSVAQLLTRALLRAAPAAVARAARSNWLACEVLFRRSASGTPAVPSSDALEHDVRGALLADFRELAPRRGDLFVALRALFSAVAGEQDVVIAVDDFSRIDEPTAAFLGTLVRLAGSQRLVVIMALEESNQERLPAAHRFAIGASEELRLGPLDAQQTAALLGQVFGNVPNVAPVAASLFRLSQGLPRDALSLAEHMVDAGLVDFRAGSFFLPGRIDASDLPASMSATHARIVAELSPGALHLGRALVLAAGRSLALPDCMELSLDGDVHSAQLALDELGLRRLVSVSSDGYRYRLLHDGWEKALSADLGASECERLHRALARLTSSQPDRLLHVYHLLLGRLDPEALELLRSFLREIGEESERLEVLAGTKLTPTQVSKLLDLSIEAVQRLRAPRRDLSDLQHTKMMLGVFVDYAAFEEMRPIVVEELKRDSGYGFWTPPDSPDGAMPAALMAMHAAHTRFEATPPEEQTRSPQAAIQALVQFAAAGIAVGAQASNWELRRSLPDLLHPFACLSPVVDAIHENCLAVRELSFGRYEHYQDRTLAVLDRLSQDDAQSLPYVDEIRSALIYGAASADARIGTPKALERLVLLENHPRLRANAMDMKAYMLLQQGDWKEAGACYRMAEQLQMDSPMGQMFGSKFIRNEAEIYALGGDPDGVKRTIHRLEELCSKYPGWQPSLQLAQAEHARLRGDFAEALDAYGKCVELIRPLMADEGACPEWYSATAGRVEVLLEMGRAEEAVELGRRSLDLGMTWRGADALELRFHGIVRALALAESRLGDHDAALRRLEPVIERREQLGTTGLSLGLLYEACALIAGRSGDRGLQERSTQLACDQFSLVSDSAFFARAERLREPLNDAPPRPPSEEDTSPDGTSMGTQSESRHARLMAHLLRGQDRDDRARRALEILSQARGARRGHLFLHREEGLTLAASTDAAEATEPLVQFARQKLEVALAEGEMTTQFSMAGPNVIAIRRDENTVESGGVTWSAVVLATREAERRKVVGLVLLSDEGGMRSTTFVHFASAISSALIECGDVTALDAA